MPRYPCTLGCSPKLQIDTSCFAVNMQFPGGLSTGIPHVCLCAFTCYARDPLSLIGGGCGWFWIFINFIIWKMRPQMLE